MNQRNHSIDVLRALLAFMVIILHFNNSGMGGGMTNITLQMRGHWLLAQSLESLCVVAVPCFIMISGFFLSRTNKRKLSKVAFLFGITIGYNLVMYAAALVLGLDQHSAALFFGRVIPTNYYVALYSVLYLISPLINLAVERLEEKQFNSVLLMLFLLFSVWPTIADLLSDLTHWWPMGISPVAMQGNGQGYTITHFCLCYMIGMWIRRHVETWGKSCVTSLRFAGIYVAMSVLLVVESLFTSTTYYYTNVIVVVSAAALFQAFLYLPGDRGHNKYIEAVLTFLGEHSLDVFLLHTNPVLLVYFWQLFSIPTRFATLPLWKSALFLAAMVGSMYIICVAITIVFHFVLVKPLGSLVASFSHSRNRDP